MIPVYCFGLGGNDQPGECAQHVNPETGNGAGLDWREVRVERDKALRL